ncbi:MAG: PD-(D/E)XK nuclease family protein [Erysipelotrichaceae bacterium]
MFDLFSIGNNSTIIAPSYLHKELRSSLLISSNAYTNLKIISLNTFIFSNYNDTLIDPNSVYLKYYNILCVHLNELVYYKGIALQASFIKQLYDMIISIHYFNIDVLPCSNEYESELKFIINLLLPIKTVAEQTLDCINHLDKLSNVYYIDYELDYFNHMVFEKINGLGGKPIELISTDSTNSNYKIFNSRNMRIEIESCAQYIINNNLNLEDVSISYMNPNYCSNIMRIFNYYNISYNFINNSSTSIIVKRFNALLRYRYTMNCDDLLEAIKISTFNSFYTKELCTYLKLHNLDINNSYDIFTNINISENIINKYELEQMIKLEDKARTCYTNINIDINNLLNTTSLKATLEVIYEIVAKSNYEINTSSYNQFNQITNTAKTILDEVDSLKAIPFIIELFANIKANNSNEGIITISSINEIITKKKYHFVLGLNQNSFPSFNNAKGIFDEQYLKKTNYPSLENRYHQYIHIMMMHLYTTSNIIYSYSLSSYDGKNMEAAIELDMLAKSNNIQIKEYPFIHKFHEQKDIHTLESNIAKELFINSNNLNGSVSAFEMYIKCPYSYFIKYGLKIKEDVEYGFDIRKLGTLMHFVMETIINKHGKEYPNTSKEEVKEIIDQQIDEVKLVYPAYNDRFILIGERTLENMMITLTILKDAEEHSLMKPTKCEYEFDYQLESKDKLKISFKGFIDRIDESEQYFRIIDYKSSQKKLSKDSVESGQQLQLLTYLLVLSKIVKKKPLGAYYFSLKKETLPFTYGKLSRRPLDFTPYTLEDEKKAMYKSRRFNGWNFKPELNIQDDDGSHIASIRMNKDGEVVTKNIYDLDYIGPQIDKALIMIATNISNGNIKLEPNTDACKFCPYLKICRFKGTFTKKQPIINVSEEGDEDNAELD